MIRTRFPPEPNGYLHLGHVKAMLYDFEFHKDCACNLRFDDTNPDTERGEFVTAILDDVLWMGFTPAAITSTSDYFDTLYNFAETLICSNKAYVDFSSPDEIKAGRATGTESVWRSQSCDKNLEEFRKMRAGKYAEGECVLRLKINMTHENAVMRDPIAYRINFTPHYKTGTTWCIYPSYDYSHGIVDALEGITHSYCTSEFFIRRDLYLWPVRELGLTPATVIEFGRLNVEGVSLSKRKIIPLVESGELSGYDDPRLFTIKGLRARGFTPEILKTLAGLSGLDMRDTVLSKDIILHHLRGHLYSASPKMMAVTDPIELRCVDSGDCYYIERSDFREVDSPDYYRLAPGKTIRLRYGPYLEYVSHIGAGRSLIVNVKRVEPVNPKRVKGVLHWIPVAVAKPAIFEMYDDIDVASTKTIFHGVISDSMTFSETPIQFERVGFFRFRGIDSASSHPIFLKIVGLKTGM